MTVSGLKISPDLKSKYGGADWDADQNGVLSYDEIKYHGNEKLIPLFNEASYDETSVPFFMSLPPSRAATLFILSTSARPLADRYIETAASRDQTWVQGLIEAVFASGDRFADKTADRILIFGAEIDQRLNILTNIGKMKYVKERLGILIQLPGSNSEVRVTRENVREFPFEQIKKPLQDALTKNYIAATFLTQMLDPEKRGEVIGGRIQDDYSKLVMAKQKGLADHEEFESLESLIRNLSEDTELFSDTYRWLLHRDSKMAKALLIFPNEEQINGLMHQKSCPDMAVDLKEELAIRAHGGRVLQVETQSDYDQWITNSKRPVLVVFGAGWCNSCQFAKPKLEHWARFYQGEMSVAYVHIDRSNDLETIYEHTNSPSLPSYGIFHKKKLKIDSDWWLGNELRRKINKLLLSEKRGHAVSKEDFK